jgi:hypothetical protein
MMTLIFFKKNEVYPEGLGLRVLLIGLVFGLGLIRWWRQGTSGFAQRDALSAVVWQTWITLMRASLGYILAWYLTCFGHPRQLLTKIKATGGRAFVRFHTDVSCRLFMFLGKSSDNLTG